MNEFDKCYNCSAYIEESKRVLKESDSVFDAAFDMDQFVKNCKRCFHSESLNNSSKSCTSKNL